MRLVDLLIELMSFNRLSKFCSKPRLKSHINGEEGLKYRCLPDLVTRGEYSGGCPELCRGAPLYKGLLSPFGERKGVGVGQDDE